MKLSIGDFVFKDGALTRVDFAGGFADMTGSSPAFFHFLTDHLGSVRAVINGNASTTTYPLSGFYSVDDFAPFGTKSASSASSYLSLASTGTTVSLRDGFTGQEDQMPDFSVGYIDFGARQYSATLSRWLVPDPLGEKYYDVSPYAYCAGNPVNKIDPTGTVIDDYYSSLNGKYLGSDAYGASARLIDPEDFQAISKGNRKIQSLSTTNDLRNNSKVIRFDTNKIENDAQRVADQSRQNKVEYQVYIVLDQMNAVVTSFDGPTGDNTSSTLEYYPGKTTGASFYNKPGGPIIIGQIHGHPASTKPGAETLKTMSPNYDVPTAVKLQIPLYGVDAMYGEKGDAMYVHRVTPSGEVLNNIRQTIGTQGASNYNNWGLEALQLWGKSNYPSY